MAELQDERMRDPEYLLSSAEGFWRRHDAINAIQFIVFASDNLRGAAPETVARADALAQAVEAGVRLQNQLSVLQSARRRIGLLMGKSN